MIGLGENETLSLKLLSYKTITLTALAAAARVSELHKINIQLMAAHPSKYLCHFSSKLKHSRNNRAIKPLEFAKYEENPNLCPVATITAYKQRTDPLRTKGQTQLFISQIKPHQEVTKQTLATWVKQVLKCTGVDISKFKSHSTRSASTSKAATRGASLKDILDRGHWSNASTWQKFYNKDIESSACRFQNMILKR